jgi:hypothetical protein
MAARGVKPRGWQNEGLHRLMANWQWRLTEVE